ncbi:hypothetical protein M569_13256 [Genlisea aurea]|uniref:F-box domain-containing protein n=1 Tax=Genlisea aurea TaxID=192259 RepID=S8CAY2_9LAMI|nr:hypothetical protein M569_13256 [Genlisea aurea]
MLDSLPYIPSDIVFQILSRTPTLPLLQTYRTVSKEWNSIIREPTFLPEYCRNTGNLSGFILQVPYLCDRYRSNFASLDGAASSFPNLPEDVQILAASSTTGILCCLKMGKTHRDGGRYHVCKPATGQWKSLPNPKLRYVTKSVSILVLGSNPVRFKIVRISKDYRPSRDPRRRRHRCEVFDSGSWRWNQICLFDPPDGEFMTNKHHVSVGTRVYWKTSNENIMAFDGRTDSFISGVPIPEELRDGRTRLTEMDGKLGLIVARDGGIAELRLMKGEEGRWEKEIEIDVEEANRKRFVYHPHVEGFCNRGIAFLVGFWSVKVYKIGEGSITDLPLPGKTHPLEVFPFRSDFEPLPF